MSEGGTVWDAPNQQVVRPDESAPWDEGDGGSMYPTPKETNPLDEMTKDELLAYAQERDLDVTAAMAKADIRAAIDQYEAGG
jgi:hypothetical protein